MMAAVRLTFTRHPAPLKPIVKKTPRYDYNLMLYSTG